MSQDEEGPDIRAVPELDEPLTKEQILMRRIFDSLEKLTDLWAERGGRANALSGMGSLIENMLTAGVASYEAISLLEHLKFNMLVKMRERGQAAAVEDEALSENPQ